MYLLVVHTDDVAALWLYRQLRQLGFGQLELLSIEQLQHNRELTMWQQGGKAAFRIALQDGRRFDSENVDGLLNRVRYLDFASASAFQSGDRDYVAAELSAIFTCWGSAFGESGSVFNTVTTSGFGGRDRSEAEWLLLARSAGLRTAAFYQDCTGAFYQAAQVPAHETWEVLVFRGQCFCAARHLPPELAERCADLQQRSEEHLIGIRLGEIHGEPTFLSATMHPDLRAGGMPFVEHLQLWLEQMSLL